MFKIGSIKIDTNIKEDDFFDLYKKISDLENLHTFINEQPVYPEWGEEIQKMEFLRAVQGTIALEGSELELEDIERIASQKDVSLSDKDKEAENALEAYEFIQDWSELNKGQIITEEVIKQIHTIMTRNINYYLNEPGKYRNQVVEFGYPKQKSSLKNTFEVQEAMSRVVDFINSPPSKGLKYSSFPVTKAILTHHFMTYIHPFIDGNGRVSRAVEALMFHHYGGYEPYLFPISARFYYKERKTYFELLRKIDTTGDPYTFISFALDGIYKNLTEIKNNILDQVTRTLIFDYAHQLRRNKKLLKRQTSLLGSMFYLKPMELQEFWRHPAIQAIYYKLSESTKKRDISNLVRYNLVQYIDSASPEEKVKKITVNWDALRLVALRLDNIPHRPSTLSTEQR
jgi:Fic family protein